MHFYSLIASINAVKDQLEPSFADDLERNITLLTQQMDIAIDTFEAALLITGHIFKVQLLCSLDFNVETKDGQTIRLTALTKLKGPQ